MNLTKFDYVVDIDHTLIALGAEGIKSLSGMCPVLVGRLTEQAGRLSNAELVIVVDNAESVLEIASAIRQLGELPDDIAIGAAKAFVSMSIASVELGKRYVAGTLDPVYHVGTDAAIEHARQAIAAQKSAQQAAQAI